MNWRNEFGRLVKRLESKPLSPTASEASSESWSSIALSNTTAIMNPLENNPDPDKAIDYLNDLAEKAHTWTGPSIADGTNRSKTGVLSRKLQALETKDSKVPQTVARVESQDNCFICGGVDHLAQVCPTLSEMRGVYEEQCNSLGTYRKPFSPYSNTYNPGWRNHPNFSWKNDVNHSSSSNNNHWKPEAPLS
ncbi:hypothetical protein ACOSQ3_014197 [Xanthoceras sorbifolium]